MTPGQEIVEIVLLATVTLGALWLDWALPFASDSRFSGFTSAGAAAAGLGSGFLMLTTSGPVPSRA